MIELSNEIYVLADSTKFGKNVTIGIAPLSEIDYVITDHNINKLFINQFKKTNTNLIVLEA